MAEASRSPDVGTLRERTVPPRLEDMRLVYRARDEPSATREERWRHILERTIGPMEVRFADGPGDDRIVTHRIGRLLLTESTMSAGEVVRTTGHVRRADDDAFHVFIQLRGRVMGEQAGRRVRLGPGDLSLVDRSRPFRCVHPAARSLCLTFPRPLLPLPQEDVDQLAGARVPAHSGAAGLVRSLVRQLPRHADETGGGATSRLGVAVVDVVAAALGDWLGRGDRVPPPARDAALLARIHAFVEDRLADPGLSPGAIAAAHHISVRQLHELFRTQDTTVSGLIRRRRLERCRRDLADPSFASTPVSAIGARHGLVDPAHFSRAFRQEFGMPPTEYRALVSAH